MTGRDIHAAAATVIALLVFGARYMGSCLLKPKRRCWVCRRHSSKNVPGRIWGDCWWCHGKGYRWRYGKRIYDRWSGRRRK